MRLNYVDDWWPKELIPFGYDGGGNSFCFIINNGQIYYVYEDDSDDDGNVPIEYVAPDSEFLRRPCIYSRNQEKSYRDMIRKHKHWGATDEWALYLEYFPDSLGWEKIWICRKW